MPPDSATGAGDTATATFVLDYADFLESHVDRWTMTTDGTLVDGFTATAPDEPELLQDVVRHAEEAHGVKEVTPELAAKVKAAIQDR